MNDALFEKLQTHAHLVTLVAIHEQSGHLSTRTHTYQDRSRYVAYQQQQKTPSTSEQEEKKAELRTVHEGAHSESNVVFEDVV